MLDTIKDLILDHWVAVAGCVAWGLYAYSSSGLSIFFAGKKSAGAGRRPLK